MPPVLSYPFRITAAGLAATVEHDSDQGRAERLAVLILTRRGEMPLAGDYGLTDPAFAGIERSELAAQVVKWGPKVKLGAVTAATASQSTSTVRVTFT